MKQQRVALYYHCKTPTGWKRFPAALNKLKNVRPKYAQVGSEQILYSEGHYVLRHYVDRRPHWKNVGPDAMEAQRQQTKMSQRFAAEVMADAAGTRLEDIDADKVTPLIEKAKEFIVRQRTRGKKRHARQLERELPEFIHSVKVKSAEQLTEALVLRWYDELQNIGNKHYTLRNKHVNVFGFLKWAGIDTKPLAPNGPPKSVTRKVQVYTPEELDRFFATIKQPYHRLVFRVLLMTGLREKEAATLEWHNFDFEHDTVTVLYKPELGLEIKDRAERTIPLPDELKEDLLAWHTAHPKSRFVLGNSKDKPNGEWLPMLKRIARRGRLECGVCEVCRDTDKKKWTQEKGGCKRWTLKKFRSTYATTMLRNGVDPRTLMSWTGHEDLETIMLYMAPAESREVKDKVNRVVWMRPAKKPVVAA